MTVPLRPSRLGGKEALGKGLPHHLRGVVAGRLLRRAIEDGHPEGRVQPDDDQASPLKHLLREASLSREALPGPALLQG